MYNTMNNGKATEFGQIAFAEACEFLAAKHNMSADEVVERAFTDDKLRWQLVQLMMVAECVSREAR